MARVLEFLTDSGLTLGLGVGQISELSDAKSLPPNLARFLVSVPTGILKNWDEIISEEVEAHPSHRTDSLEHKLPMSELCSLRTQ